MAQTFSYYTDTNGTIWQLGVNTNGQLVATVVASIPGVPTAPIVAGFQSITGQGLLTLVQNNLAGLSNAFTVDQILAFINEGKDEVWAALKQLSQKYFVISTQTTDTTKTSYFAALSTSAREYTLPIDCRDILFIEVTAPGGYEEVQFIRRDILSQDFRMARRDATANGSSGSNPSLVYYYDVVGQNTLMLAQYPETTFTLTIWYVRGLVDITLNTSIDEILYPFSKKIVDYAVMKMRLVKDPSEFAAWKDVWKSDLVSMSQTATRDAADPQFADEFYGGGW